MKSLKYLLLILLISGYLSSCNPLINLAQPIQTDTVTISPNANVGQTLMATYRGLEGIGVYLFPQPASEGYLRLHLRASPDSNYDLQVTDIPLAKIKKPQFISFQFSPQADSFKKDYYFFIELLGRGEVAIAKTAGDAYLNGAMYVNHTAEDAQLTFRLKYDRYQAFIGICREVLSWLWFTLIGILLYILPGWALLSLLYQNWTGLCWGEKLGLSAGMSLAIYPILMLWTNLVGLHLGAFYAWIPVAFGIITISCKNKRHLNITSLKFSYTQNTIPDLAFFIVIGMVLAVRFWVIRTLDAPMWGDSYQHTVISQLLVDHNGLFTSWEPYADLTTFTYHFGFHSAVAAFYWLTHQIMPQSVLWVGQILNALAAMCLYPLAMKIAHNRWAGVTAVLIAGLLSPMPMFFTNWGRYTQLTGLVILPGLIFMFLAFSKQKNLSIKNIALLSFFLAGLALTHYRILLYGFAFLVVYLLIQDVFIELKNRFFTLLWSGLFALIIFLPWLINITNGKLVLQLFKSLHTPVNSLTPSALEYNTFSNLGNYFPTSLWVLTLLSVGFLLWKQNTTALKIILWCLFDVIISNPYLLKLPGTGLTNNFTMLISAYLPTSILLGGFIANLPLDFIRLKAKQTDKLLTFLVLIIITVLSFWGSLQRYRDIQPQTFTLVTRPDIRAAKWIKMHIPENGYFLVNSFLAFSNTTVVGSDAGWWIPVLANRNTTLPPINYVFEKNVYKEYPQDLKNFITIMNEHSWDLDQTIELIKAKNISYVYIGQQRGNVNFSGSILDPIKLMTSSFYKLVYHQDWVWIFKVQR